MTRRFSLRPAALVVLDDRAFRRCGGEELRFGAIVGDTVTLTATGPVESIRAIAADIRESHVADW